MLSGFLAQPAAVGLAIIMLGAMNLKKNVWKKKFIGDGGWELDFMIFAACIMLLISGAGAFALDRVLFAI